MLGWMGSKLLIKTFNLCRGESMKISELKKRADFDDLVEYAHRMVEAYEEYDQYRVNIETTVVLDENPMALARRLDKYYKKE